MASSRSGPVIAREAPHLAIGSAPNRLFARLTFFAPCSASKSLLLAASAPRARSTHRALPTVRQSRCTTRTAQPHRRRPLPAPPAAAKHTCEAALLSGSSTSLPPTSPPPASPPPASPTPTSHRRHSRRRRFLTLPAPPPPPTYTRAVCDLCSPPSPPNALSTARSPPPPPSPPPTHDSPALPAFTSRPKRFSGR